MNDLIENNIFQLINFIFLGKQVFFFSITFDNLAPKSKLLPIQNSLS